MRATTLSLTTFRCFADLRLELPEGLIAIVGPNASGKTSILEALFVASSGRSPRATRDAEMVNWGQDVARVEADMLRDDGRPLDVVFELHRAGEGPRKRLVADGKPVRRSAELMARVPLVLFVPADLQLAQAAPVVRRRFMNLALARLGAAYADDLARYRRALLQRNRLLCEGAPAAELRPWDAALIEAGSHVVHQRRRLAADLADVAPRIHGDLAGPRERLGVSYTSQVGGDDAAESADAYAAALARHTAEERRLGRTLVGPHRDDLRLLVNGRPLRRYGSQGQQRTAALALKLGEAELLHRRSGEAPILLLDDCLSELDEGRAGHVLGLTGAYRQLIVTSAAREAALGRADVAAWIRLGEGQVPEGA